MDFWTLLTRGNALVSLVERVAPEKTREPTFQEAKAELVRAAQRSKSLGAVPLAWPALAWAVRVLTGVAAAATGYVVVKGAYQAGEITGDLARWTRNLVVIAGVAYTLSYVLPTAADTYRRTFR